MGALACFAALIALALAVPSDPWDEFYAENYVSKFARSGVTAVGDLMTRGLLDSDATMPDRLATLSPARPAAGAASRRTSSWCSTSSSFDISAVPGVKVPAGYGAHFKSCDGKQRIAHGRRRGRPELVHRIQRADRPVGALLWALRRFRHAHRGRARRARPAAGAAATAATRPSRSIRCTARSSARATSSRPPASSTSSMPRRSARISSSRTRSISTRRRDTIAKAARQGAAVPAGLHRAEPFPVGLPLPSRSGAGLARPRQPAGRRRISAPAAS